MRVIICGAGQVGWQIARQLSSEGNSVALVDTNPELIRRAIDALDVQGVVGFASHPSVLEAAGANEADLIIAATRSDEVNLATCQIARARFDVTRTIARLRTPDYMAKEHDQIFGRDGFAVDVTINPEREVALAALRRIAAPSTLDIQEFLDGRVRLAGIALAEDCPVLETPLRALSILFEGLRAIVVGVRRGERLFAPEPEDQLFAGDEIYIVSETSELPRVLGIFGKPVTYQERILLIGGGNVGVRIAQALEAAPERQHVKLVERDRGRAEAAAEALRRTIVLLGDGFDADLLSEAGIERTDVMLAVTDDDRTNLLAAVRAKALGCKFVVALINDPSLSELLAPLRIDAAINPRAATVSSILRHVRHGRVRAIHSLGDGEAEVIEAQILSTSPLAGKVLSEAGLPQGALLGALIKEGQLVKITARTRFDAGDLLVVFVLAQDVPEVQRLLSVAVEYF